MDLPVAIPVIDTAVSLRTISGYKEERVQASALYENPAAKINTPVDTWIQLVEDALYFGTIMSYAQGLSQLYQASIALKMEIPLPKAVKVWRGGCIIRSVLLETYATAYEQSPDLPNILLSKDVAALVNEVETNTRTVVAQAAQAGIPVGAIMAALSYFDAYRTERMPTNLVQAQRDYFGAHTYQRIDMPGTFHTVWEQH
jgi:6-phosphogluconate dehydrogenase